MPHLEFSNNLLTELSQCSVSWERCDEDVVEIWINLEHHNIHRDKVDVNFPSEKIQRNI